MFCDSSSGILIRLPLTPCSEDSWVPESVRWVLRTPLHVLCELRLLGCFGGREIPNASTFHNLSWSVRTVSGRFTVTTDVTRFIYNSFIGIQKLFNFSVPFYSSECVFRVDSLSLIKQCFVWLEKFEIFPAIIILCEFERTCHIVPAPRIWKRMSGPLPHPERCRYRFIVTSAVSIFNFVWNPVHSPC